MSKSSKLSVNTPFIFEMLSVNGALFLKAKSLFLKSIKFLSPVFLRVISPLTEIYELP